MFSRRRASLRPAAVGLLVGGLALASASCTLGRTAPEPAASSLVVRIHAIGSNLSWTSPGVSVGPGMLAILDVNSDPFGDCSSSSLHTIVTSDSVPLAFH